MMNLTCLNRNKFDVLDRFIVGSWGDYASYVGVYPTKDQVYAHISSGDFRPDDYLWDMRDWHSVVHMVGCKSLIFSIETQLKVRVPLDNMFVSPPAR